MIFDILEDNYKEKYFIFYALIFYQCDAYLQSTANRKTIYLPNNKV